MISIGINLVSVDGVDVVEVEPVTRNRLNESGRREILKLKDISPPAPHASHMIQRHNAMSKPQSHPAKPISILEFGPYASFAPNYDSTDSSIEFNDYCTHVLYTPMAVHHAHQQQATVSMIRIGYL